MSDLEPNRPRFQIHLSTALILMFVAGGIIWANLRVNNSEYLRKIDEESVKEIADTAKKGIFVYPLNWKQLSTSAEYGWPATAFYSGSRLSVRHVKQSGVIINLAAAVLILYFVWFICERGATLLKHQRAAES